MTSWPPRLTRHSTFVCSLMLGKGAFKSTRLLKLEEEARFLRRHQLSVCGKKLVWKQEKLEIFCFINGWGRMRGTKISKRTPKPIKAVPAIWKLSEYIPWVTSAEDVRLRNSTAGQENRWPRIVSRLLYLIVLSEFNTGPCYRPPDQTTDITANRARDKTRRASWANCNEVK